MKNAAADSKHEIVQLTNEALKLASAACHFDKSQNVVGACDYYDKCLLNIDEVLNKLQPNSDEWKQLLAIRSKYDDRMEWLRENESVKFNFAGSSTKTDSRSMVVKRSPRKRVMFNDDSYITDATGQSLPLEDTPIHLAEIPYWQLRNINRTIQEGGFLTNEVFIPKKIWTNAAGIKFSGLAAKTTAFEIIIKSITTNLDPLYLSDDEDSLSLAEAAFIAIEEELMGLMNQLSKPFPYIKETSISPYTTTNIAAAAAASAITTSYPSSITATGGAPSLSTPMANTDDQSASSELITSPPVNNTAQDSPSTKVIVTNKVNMFFPQS